MLSPNVLAAFLQRYGVPPTELKFLGGTQNIVYACEGRSLIIRISKCRHRSQFQVEAELKWILFLAERGIHACVGISTKSGESCLTIELDGEVCVAACFERAPGSEISPGGLNESLYFKLGTLLGEMHAAAVASNCASTLFHRPHWDQSRLLREDFEEQKERLTGQFCEQVADLIQSLNLIPQTGENYGLVHGDSGFGNCFLHQGELWIFDFDNCEYGYFLQDLATVLYDSIYCRQLNKFADPGLNDRMASCWGALLSGYSETGSLKEIDPCQLKKFFLLREVIIYVHYHRTLDLRNVSDSFKAGLEVMRHNIENQIHQVDFDYLMKSQKHLNLKD